MSAVPAAALLAALAFAALLADSLWAVAAIALVLLVPCLRAPRAHRRLYLVSVGISAGLVFVLWPWLQNTGSHPFWHGPIVPVLGELTVTREELSLAGAVRAAFRRGRPRVRRVRAAARSRPAARRRVVGAPLGARRRARDAARADARARRRRPRRGVAGARRGGRGRARAGRGCSRRCSPARSSAG